MSIEKKSDSLKETANSFFSKKSLSDQDVVDYKNTGFSFTGVTTQAVNFQYILKTGKIPYAKFLGSSTLYDLSVKESEHNLYIDLDSDDEYTRALKTIKENVIGHINEIKENSDEAKAFFAKEHWSYQDKTSYEHLLSTLVSEQRDRFPALNGNNYRTEGSTGFWEGEVHRSPRLNDLSQDMRKPSPSLYTLESDCEHLAATQGYVMQAVDNEILPKIKIPGNYKTVSNYFYISNETSDEEKHAVVMSSATAHVFDPAMAEDAQSCMVASSPDYIFDNFIEGEPLVPYKWGTVDNNGLVYKNSYISPAEADTARAYTRDQRVLKYYKTQLNAEIEGYPGFPTDINNKGEHLTFAEAIKDPKLYDMIYTMYEMQGDTEALERMQNISLYDRKIQEIEDLWKEQEKHTKATQIKTADDYAAAPIAGPTAPAA